MFCILSRMKRELIPNLAGRTIVDYFIRYSATLPQSMTVLYCSVAMLPSTSVKINTDLSFIHFGNTAMCSQPPYWWTKRSHFILPQNRTHLFVPFLPPKQTSVPLFLPLLTVAKRTFRLNSSSLAPTFSLFAPPRSLHHPSGLCQITSDQRLNPCPIPVYNPPAFILSCSIITNFLELI